MMKKKSKRKRPTGSRYQMIHNLRRTALVILSALLSAGIIALGAFLRLTLPAQTRTLFFVPFGVSVAVLFTGLFVSLFGSKRYFKKVEKLDPAEGQAMFLRQRELARQTRDSIRKPLYRLLLLSDLWAVILTLDVAVLLLSAVICLSEGINTLLCISGMVLMISLVWRIRLPDLASIRKEEPQYLPEEQFPRLYGMMRKAANATGCGRCSLFIIAVPGSDASVSVGGRTVTLLLGLDILCTFSEEELYAVLLHECSHARCRLVRPDPVDAFGNWVHFNGYGEGLCSFFFQLTDMVYAFRYMLYQRAVSVLEEENADRAMLLASPEAAASALLRLYHFGRYEWESSAEDGGFLFFAGEEVSADLIRRSITHATERIAQRRAVWDPMLGQEILARNATHPTIGMRIAAMGIENPHLIEDNSPPAYCAETDEAMAYIGRVLLEDKEEYTGMRENSYLKPLRTLEAWEKEGEPLVRDGYRDVLSALLALRQIRRAEALCDKVIAAFSPPPAAYAMLCKGQIMVRRYENEGVDWLYRAMEQNENYIDCALETAGQYFCFVGDEKGLEDYRAKAVKMARKQKEVVSKREQLSHHDTIVPEPLEGDMRERLAAFLRKTDNGTLNEVRIVRKIITPTEFVSVVTLKIRRGASADMVQEIFRRVFNYLDTTDENWHFILFDAGFADTVLGRKRIEKTENSLLYRGKDAEDAGSKNKTGNHAPEKGAPENNTLGEEDTTATADENEPGNGTSGEEKEKIRPADEEKSAEKQESVASSDKKEPDRGAADEKRPENGAPADP